MSLQCSLIMKSAQVKSIMLDSANETIVELKAELKEISQELEESRELAETTNNRALQIEEDTAGQVENLR